MSRRDTRELVLQTSLLLFNELGEPNVTTNHIADAADISPGNLYYHFRSKDDIALALFERFLERFLPLVNIPDGALLNAEELWFQLHLAFEAKGEYRFLYRNLADLTARIPDLDRAMRGLLMRERTAVRNSLSGLENNSVLHLDYSQKERLIDSVLLHLTYWIPFSDLFNPDGLEDGTAQVEAIASVLMLISPHLRDPERDQFESLAERYLAR